MAPGYGTRRRQPRKSAAAANKKTTTASAKKGQTNREATPPTPTVAEDNSGNQDDESAAVPELTTTNPKEKDASDPKLIGTLDDSKKKNRGGSSSQQQDDENNKPSRTNDSTTSLTTTTLGTGRATRSTRSASREATTLTSQKNRTTNGIEPKANKPEAPAPVSSSSTNEAKPSEVSAQSQGYNVDNEDTKASSNVNEPGPDTNSNNNNNNNESLPDSERRIKDDEDMRMAEYLLTQLKEGAGRSVTPQVSVHSPPPESPKREEAVAAAAAEKTNSEEENGFSALETLAAVAVPMQDSNGNGNGNGEASASRSRRISNADTLLIEDSSTSGDTQVDEDPFSLRPNISATQATDGDTSVMNTPVAMQAGPGDSTALTEYNTEATDSMVKQEDEEEEQQQAEVEQSYDKAGVAVEPAATNGVDVSEAPAENATISDTTIDAEGDTQMEETSSNTPPPPEEPPVQEIQQPTEATTTQSTNEPTSSTADTPQAMETLSSGDERELLAKQALSNLQSAAENNVAAAIAAATGVQEVEMSEDIPNDVPEAVPTIVEDKPADIPETTPTPAAEKLAETVNPASTMAGLSEPLQRTASTDSIGPEFSQALARSAVEALNATMHSDADSNIVHGINSPGGGLQPRMPYDHLHLGHYTSSEHAGQSPQPGSEMAFDHGMDTDMHDQGGEFMIDPALINEGRTDNDTNNTNNQLSISNQPNFTNSQFSFNQYSTSPAPNPLQSNPNLFTMAPKNAQSGMGPDEIDTPIDCCAMCHRGVPIVASGSRMKIVKTNWVQCDGCSLWFHHVCINMSERDVDDIDKYFCPNCENIKGTTTYRRRSKRAHQTIDYQALNEGSKAPFAADGDQKVHQYVPFIKENPFTPDNFPRLPPDIITKKYFEEGDGFKTPILVPAAWNPRPAGETPDKLGMVIPPGLTVRKVGEVVGLDEKVIVLDVKKQTEDENKWNFGRWVDYFESAEKEKVLNVISQEISHTEWGKRIKRPKVVEEIDLAKHVWPQDLIKEFPKVTLYCLMSVKDSYTDFHIDFGGSSVFYHIVSGSKTFLFMPPTPANLSQYEKWCLLESDEQNSTFLPTLLNNPDAQVMKVELEAGDTMFIPSGWIHAVHTPEDSLVFGGNFLTPLSLEQQIKIAQIEKTTKVNPKFKYPKFQSVMWYTALQYLKEDPLPEEYHTDAALLKAIKPSDSPNKKRKKGNVAYSKWEVDGFRSLEEYLLRTALISMGVIVQGITQEVRKRVKKAIPKAVGNDALSAVQLFARWAAWKRNDGYIAPWALKSWSVGDGISGTAVEKRPEEETKLTPAQEKKMKKAAEAQKRRDEGPAREGLRKKDSTQEAETPKPAKDASTKETPVSKRFGSASDFKPDFKATQAKISQTVQPNDPPKIPKKKGRPPKKRDPETEQQPKKPETPAPKKAVAAAAAQTPATAPAKASSSASGTTATPAPRAPNSQPRHSATEVKISALHENLSRSIKQKFEHTSSPKNSILGPKRTACDDCRRQKISCKHKAEVALAEEELVKELAKNVQEEQAQNPQSFTMLEQQHQHNPRADPAQDLPYKISKNGRPVACETCKKSRRRCTHNGQGDFPPAAKRNTKQGSESGKGKHRLSMGTPTPLARLGSIGSDSSAASFNADMNGFTDHDGMYHHPVNGTHPSSGPTNLEDAFEPSLSNPFALPQSNFTDDDPHGAYDPNQPRPNFLSVALNDNEGGEATLGDQGIYADPNQFNPSAPGTSYGPPGDENHYPHFEAEVEAMGGGGSGNDDDIVRPESGHKRPRPDEFDHYTNDHDDADGLDIGSSSPKRQHQQQYVEGVTDPALENSVVTDPALFMDSTQMGGAGVGVGVGGGEGEEEGKSPFSLRGQKRQREEDDTLLTGEDVTLSVGSPGKKVCL